jgi:hypothetical protein
MLEILEDLKDRPFLLLLVDRIEGPILRILQDLRYSSTRPVYHVEDVKSLGRFER